MKMRFLGFVGFAAALSLFLSTVARAAVQYECRRINRTTGKSSWVIIWAEGEHEAMEKERKDGNANGWTNGGCFLYEGSCSSVNSRGVSSGPIWVKGRP